MSSSEVVRAILVRNAREPGNRGPVTAADALEASCTRVTQSLCNSLGAVGSAALFDRAFARAEHAYPILKELHGHDDECVRIVDIARSVEAHGAEAVALAVEALLAELIDLLTRLVGEAMAMRLISGDDAQRPDHLATAP